jgi:2-succinyl-6-hydroxy-2,4-cyclohexadiene-1-carboxylate synthase
MDMENHTLHTADGIRYHLVTSGKGSPLLALHGFTGSSTTWEAYLPVWASLYRVIAPDLLGHGDTDAPADAGRYQMGAAAADMAALIDQFAETPVHLLGYSMGGRLALYIALHYPERVRSLILESASPGLMYESERAARRTNDEALATKLESDGLQRFIESWERMPVFASQTDEVRMELRSLRMKHSAEGLANSLRGMGTGMQPALWDDLSRLNMPVLLINGALDTKYDLMAARMAVSIPDVQRLVVPDAGHTAHFEQPARFQAGVLDFLRSVEARWVG